MLRWVNLALLVLFPVAWAAPVLKAGLLPLFGLSEISVLSGVQALWGTDRALAVLVVVLAMVLPILKTLGLAAIHFGLASGRVLPVIHLLGKLAMAEVFLIALYVVAVKGTGLGHVETAWGLWLFTGCVGLSLAVSLATRR